MGMPATHDKKYTVITSELDKSVILAWSAQQLRQEQAMRKYDFLKNVHENGYFSLNGVLTEVRAAGSALTKVQRRASMLYIFTSQRCSEG